MRWPAAAASQSDCYTGGSTVMPLVIVIESVPIMIDCLV